MFGNLLKLTKEDLMNAPRINEYEVECTSLVIVPEKQLHDSGFACMSYVLLDEDNNIIGKIGGSSDALHLNRKKKWARYIIDCLPCGFVRLIGVDKITGNGFSDVYVNEEDLRELEIEKEVRMRMEYEELKKLSEVKLDEVKETE